MIGDSRPSITGRDLISSLGLQLIQKTPGKKVISSQGKKQEAETSSAEPPLDQWHLYFSKQFNNLFCRVGKTQKTTKHKLNFSKN